MFASVLLHIVYSCALVIIIEKGAFVCYDDDYDEATFFLGRMSKKYNEIILFLFMFGYFLLLFFAFCVVYVSE